MKDTFYIIVLVVLAFCVGVLFMQVVDLKNSEEKRLEAFISDYLENHDFVPITQ